MLNCPIVRLLVINLNYSCSRQILSIRISCVFLDSSYVCHGFLLHYLCADLTFTQLSIMNSSNDNSSVEMFEVLAGVRS